MRAQPRAYALGFTYVALRAGAHRTYGLQKPLRRGQGYSFTMKLGKTFSFMLLLAVAISSVGFTTLSWYCPMAKQARAETATCGACAADKQETAPSCEDDSCCEKHGQIMKIQPELSAAVKLQPNVDSPQVEGLVQLSDELATPAKDWSHVQLAIRALPDRVAHEHVVLRI
jgi:hypothetical protein